MKEHQSHQEDIQGLLQEQFEGFEDRPDRDVWAAIEAEMATTPAKRKAWLPYLMVAASVALLLCMLLLLQRPPSSDVLVEQQPAAPTEQMSPAAGPPAKPQESPTAEAIDVPTTEESPAEAPQVYQVAKVSPLQPPSQEPKSQTVDQPEDEYEFFAEVTPISEQETPNIKPLSADQLQSNLQGEKPLSGAPIEAGVPIQAGPNRVRRIGQRNTLDMNELTLSDAVQFASNELEKLAASPIKVHQEQKGNGEVKTYQFSFLDLRITTKSHRKRSR